ncbi:uncharacterized protein [Eurosta solidaginis]|uniref:uncharacterized protein n=1 Tax=Eurosta solidaginis TaxID=178769 RepID=UPI0035314A73
MVHHQFAIAPLSILIFFTSSCLVTGEVLRDGSCPDIQYLSSEGLTFKGKWYMHSRYPFKRDGDYRCYKSEYTRKSKTVHKVKNFKISNTDDCVKIQTATFTSLPDGQFQVQGDAPGAPFVYHKILTYCKDYFITYSCNNLPSKQHVEFLFVHTRVANPDQSIEAAYKLAISDKQISTLELESVRHDDCPFY